MIHISVTKDLFDNILKTKEKIVEKKVTNYWKKELLDIAIIEDKIHYNIKKVERISISNGLGDEKPSLVVECTKIDYNTKKNIFEFHIGRIIEKKNILIEDDYKDSLIQQLLKEKEILQDSMHRDHLTNLYNRRKMEEDLNAFIGQNNAKFLTAIFVDADRFKGINDNFGHDVGDRVLKSIANKLNRHANRLNGEAYRYGGEEFIMLCFMPQESLLQGLEYLKNEIQADRILHDTKDISVTVSMGVSFWKNHVSIEKFIKSADDCVYMAKKNGRNLIEVAYN
ncbi:MAG: GGDEF domain-containing protein [Candidatus Marinarcus sp.]|uniref:GGDEF domain-containing protein n=1 Tax=Candidatus Marinarcus sp. TaxID=3100987 RepID=UPI003B00D1E1